MSQRNDRRRLLKTYRFVLQKCFEVGIYDEDVRRLAEALGIGERTYWSAKSACARKERVKFQDLDPSEC